MSLFEAFVLGILQGASEFLPVSSSGHLVLVPWWLGWESPPLIYTVLVHLGTSVAIILYFWRDWLNLLRAGFIALRRREFQKVQEGTDDRLLFYLIIGSVPAGIAGLLLESRFESLYSDPGQVALMLFVTAGLLTFSEYYSLSDRAMESMRISDALFIGFAQTIALVPGISRSGATIAAGLARRLSRPDATRYSFLLATPVILGAGAKQLLNVLLGDVPAIEGLGQALAVGFVTSLISGYLCIALLLRLVRGRRLYGFAIYCVAFGGLSLMLALARG